MTHWPWQGCPCHLYSCSCVLAIDFQAGGVPFILKCIHSSGSFKELRAHGTIISLQTKIIQCFLYQIRENKANVSTLCMWNITHSGPNFSTNLLQVCLWRRGLSLSADPYPDSDFQLGLQALLSLILWECWGSHFPQGFLLLQLTLTLPSLGAFLVGHRYIFLSLLFRGLTPCLLTWKKCGANVRSAPDVPDAFINSALFPTWGAKH